MKLLRWPSLLSLITGILLLGDAASSHAQAQKLNKVLVYPAPGESIKDLQQKGLSKIQDYGSYWLVEATDQQFFSLKAAHGDRAVKGNYLNVIELGACPVDTSVGEPTIASELKDKSVAGQRLRLIQFSGPVLPEWLDKIKAAGVKVITYIPNNTYLVQLDDKAEANLRPLLAPTGPIQWMGAFHPYYKLGRGLPTTGNTPLVVQFTLLDDETASQTLQQVKNLALNVVQESALAGRRTVTAKVNPASVTAAAQLPGVLHVELVQPVSTRDEKQDLIVATFTNGPGFGPLAGASYIDFLTNTVGFSTDSAQYPVLEISDTGLDIGAAVPIHSDFYEFGPTVSNVVGFALTDPRVVSYVDYTPCPDPDACEPCGPPIAHDGCGHGTHVASVAVGYNDVPDVSFDCVTRSTDLLCVTTNLVVPAVHPLNICIPTSPTATCFPVFLTNVWNTVGSSTSIVLCANNTTLSTSTVTVVRQDVDGFQIGMGVSPFGRISVSKIFDDCCGDHVPGLTELVQTAYIVGRARIQNNSWGEILITGSGGNDGVYSARSQEYDVLVRDALPTGSPDTPGPLPLNQEFIAVFSAGNANGIGIVGGFGDVLVTPPATAKNIITVGASENVRPDDGCTQFDDDSDNALDISFYSSFGSTEDGRFKPDVVAPGSSILGAQSQFFNFLTTNFVTCAGPDPFAPTDPFSPGLDVEVLTNIYECASGTSFSAPAVSGSLQLLWWFFLNKQTNELGQALLPPSPAMAKAYTVNAARYLPFTNPQTGVRDTLPSIAQGMGILDLERMFDSVPRVLRDESTPRAIDTPLITTNPVPQQTYFTKSGQSYELNATVLSNGLPFRVTLAWLDAPGSPASFKQLVNDLDLEVIQGNRTYKGNVFAEDRSVANQGAYDDLNNMESVFLPSGQTGTFKIVVRAMSIAGDGVPQVGSATDQDFALVVYNVLTNSPRGDVPNLATNDACQTALDLTHFPFTNNITLSTNIFHNVHPSPSVGRGGVEAYYKIVQPTPGTVFTVDTFGSSFDTVLSVWQVQVIPQTIFVRGECGALIEKVANNDAGGGFQSRLTFTADGSNTYYIVVEPHNDGPGGNLVLHVAASESPITTTPDSLDFGEVIVGLTSTVQTVTYANNTIVPVQITDLQITGADAADFLIVQDVCNGRLLGAGTNCSVSIVFAPSSVGDKTAELVYTDTATGSPRVVPLSGTGTVPAPVLCLSTTAALSFTNTAVGESSAPVTLVLTNCGSSALTVTNFQVLGVGSNDYAVVEDCVSGSPIGGGGTCSFSITFTPLTNGSRGAMLRIFSDATGNPHTVNLQGVGFLRAPAVCLNRSTVIFANTVVGDASAATSVVVTNCGTTNLVISAVELVGSNATEFAILGNTCIGGPITTGQTCVITLQFAPTVGGERTATLAITNNAGGSPHLVTLRGGGIISQPDAMIGKKARTRVDRKTKLVKTHFSDNVYTVTSTNQVLTQRIRRKQLRKFFIPAQNDGSVADAFKVLGGGSTAEYTVKYFIGDRDGPDVTAAVVAGDYSTSTLDPGAIQNEATLLRMEVRAATNVTAGVTNIFPITFTSVSDPLKVDRVNAIIYTK